MVVRSIGLIVGVVAAPDQLQQDHLFARRIQIVQDAVRADTQPVLGDEVGNRHLALQLLVPLSRRPGIIAQGTNPGGDSGLVVGGGLL